MPYTEKDHPMLSDDHTIRKALTSLAIEKSLLAIGKPVYDKVADTMKKEYDCYLSDCYEHPKYLIETLKKLYGNEYYAIVKLINNELEEFSYHVKITRFLEVINN